MRTLWRPFTTSLAILLPQLLVAQSPVTISLTATPYPLMYGAPVTLVATIAPSGATGRVTFYDGVTVLGIGTLTGGQTSLSTIALAPGTRRLWAHYSGASDYRPGDSAPLSEVVTPAWAGALQPNGLLTVRTKPVAIAAGDLNSDGKVDLVVANGDGTISVLLGSGTGTFATTVAYAAGAPTSLALADFNGDGKLDVGVSNGASSTVNILYGNGDGTLQPMGPGFLVGGNPRSLAAGDFDGDGNVDLATANFADGTGSVLLGKGDGTFQPALTLTAAYGSDAIAIADFNGDGFADLAVGNQNAGNVSVFLGKGDGSFQAAKLYPASLGSSSNPVAVAAFNGDTLPYLAVAASGSPIHGDTVMLTHPKTTYSPPFPAGAAVHPILAVDIDGDGLLDLVTTSATEDVVAVLMGLHSDLYHSYSYGTGAGPIAAVAGDFNGDGRVDLAVLNAKDGTISIFAGGPLSQICCSPAGRTLANIAGLAPSNVSVSPDSGTGTSATFTFIFAGSGGMENLNNVAMLFGTPANPPDFQIAPTSSCFIRYVSSGNYFILFDDLGLGSITGSPGSGGIHANSQCSLNLTYAGVYVSGADLIISLPVSFFPAYQGTQGIWMQAQDNTLTYSPVEQKGTWTVPFTATAISLGVTPSSSIFGRPVTLTASVSPAAAAGLVTFYDGGNVLGDAPIVSGTATLTTIALPTGNHSLRAYYPGNATYSLATSATVNESVTAIAGNGFAGVNGPFPVGTTPVAIAMADVNGDGLEDLIVANQGSNNISVLLGNGGGGFSQAPGSPIADGVPGQYGYAPTSVAVGDFNGDGKPDLAFVDRNDRMVWQLFGDGTGAFTSAPLPYYSSYGSVALVAADFNGDGKADLAVANYAAGTISEFLGNGSGGFTVLPQDSFGLGIPAIAAGDFNKDGYADLAVADITDGKVWILLGNRNGMLRYQSSFVAANATSITVADFNVDGKADLAFTNSAGVTIMLGDGTGAFNPAPGSPFPTGSQPSSVAVGDFNGDGVPDLAVANRADGTVSVLLGSGSGGFSPMSGSPLIVGPGTSPAGIVAGDFNGDGRTDLATVNSGTNTITVLLGSLSPTFTVSSSHSDPFAIGQSGATYTITVTNTGPITTSGTVSLTDTVPAGLTATDIQGAGWTCTLSTVSCVTSTSVSPGQSYSPIIVTVNVAATSVGSGVNQVSVSGGGAAPANASDSTTIVGPAIAIQTNPSGLQFTVDGVLQTAPKTINLAPGNHTLAVSATQAGSPGTQYAFTGWSDAGSASHIITVGATPATYDASFKTQYRLTTLLNPQPGGSVTPPSGSYFDAGSTVTLTATPNSPYVFTDWSGGATGNSNPIQITLAMPMAATATFNVPGFTCAITGDTTASVLDIQQIVNESLGVMPANDDLTHDQFVNVADVQKLIDVVLGLGCIF